MTPEKWQHVKELLSRALECPPEERSSFLHTIPEEDDLRSEVESLLTSFDDAGDFLDQPAIPLPPSSAEAEMEGRRIGPYLIDSKIGDGGMGAVYRAMRADDQFQKRVAIKLIRRGMDTDFVIERFRRERQILASLDHPNIARLLDGGATDEGLPYFVMEYIADSWPLNEYCDREKLSTSDRLILFRRVCSAVQYAHSSLIVHRDLKPSNILVTPEGTPKLLDFGIAKLLHDDHNRTVELTKSMFRIMTPEYASPEQVQGEQVTTASDVYSLGVVLYELLTGHRPYRIKSGNRREIEEAVCLWEPDKPSTVINKIETVQGVTITPEAVGDVREGSPERLRRRLRGDIDNIVLMALRKEPQRRYASVEQFSDDIRRHLQGMPVIARKDTVAYRTSKFVGRHKAGVAAAILLFFSLIGGTTVAVWQAHVANMERDRAERRFNDVRKLANSLMFEIHDVIEPLPGSTAARELLVRKAQEYLDSLMHESRHDAALQRELALVYLKIGDVQGGANRSNLGNTSGAIKNYGQALQLYMMLLAEEPDNNDLKRSLAASYGRMCTISQVAGDSAAAAENCRKETALREMLSGAQPDNITLRRELAVAYQDLGGALSMVGDIAGSRTVRAKSLAICQELVAANPSDAASQRALSHAYSRMGAIYGLTREYAASLRYFQLALETDLQSLEANPRDKETRIDLTFNYSDVGWALDQLGDARAGLASYRKALPIREQLAAADPLDARVHQALANTYGRIGRLLLKTGESEAALAHFRKQTGINESLVITDPLNVSTHTDLAEAYVNIGSVSAFRASAAASPVDAQRHWRDARAWFRKGLDIYTAVSARGGLNAEISGHVSKVRREIERCNAELTGAPKPSAPLNASGADDRS